MTMFITNDYGEISFKNTVETQQLKKKSLTETKGSNENDLSLQTAQLVIITGQNRLSNSLIL